MHFAYLNKVQSAKCRQLIFPIFRLSSICFYAN